MDKRKVIMEKKKEIVLRPLVAEEVRKNRGKEQRIFLVMAHDFVENSLERNYDVMGTTGNVYTICICQFPTCTCPDFKSRNKRCKHIYFVLSRIMKVSEDREDVKNYTNEELTDMFNKIPDILNNLKVDSHLVNMYLKIKKKPNGEIEQQDITAEMICPICLENLTETNEPMVYCKYSCGIPIHELCFEMFNKKKADVKCLLCQKDWNKPTDNRYIKLSI